MAGRMISSLIVASDSPCAAIIPAIAPRFLKVKSSEDPWLIRQARRAYVPAVDFAMARPKTVIAGSFVLTALMLGSGATMVALLALSDSGAPSYDGEHAAALAGIGVPAFACTPDLFPDLMAAAIERRDLGQWASSNDISTSHREDAAG